MFQNGDPAGFSNLIGRDTWDVVAPQVLGLFPAIARQIHRGDVKQADALAVRYVHVPSLFEGKISFDDKVKQGYDDKELDSSKVPAASLAVTRSVVAFTDAFRDTPAFDLTPIHKDGFLTSATGQLRWKQGQQPASGFFTMNTDGTKGVVGFAAGQTCDLGEITIQPKSRFSAIYVTAQEKDKTIGTSRKLLIVAMARARNTGMELNAEENQILRKGAGPIMLEPVVAEISVRRPGNAKVVVLDHDGQRTDRSLPTEAGRFTVDGKRDKTPYYLIEWN
jgi:hypothetical protein